MEALELQRRHLEKTKCDWYGLFDDDRWFEPEHITNELPTALASEDVDLWYAHSIFFEDKPDHFNPSRSHHSPVLWRVRHGDHFPRNRTIQATEGVHDDAIVAGRFATLTTPLLDYGTYTAEERRELYERFKAAGKDDDYTRAYIKFPRFLYKFPDYAVTGALMPDTKWRDLWSEKL